MGAEPILAACASFRQPLDPEPTEESTQGVVCLPEREAMLWRRPKFPRERNSAKLNGHRGWGGRGHPAADALRVGAPRRLLRV